MKCLLYHNIDLLFIALKLICVRLSNDLGCLFFVDFYYLLSEDFFPAKLIHNESVQFQESNAQFFNQFLINCFQDISTNKSAHIYMLSFKQLLFFIKVLFFNFFSLQMLHYWILLFYYSVDKQIITVNRYDSLTIKISFIISTQKNNFGIAMYNTFDPKPFGFNIRKQQIKDAIQPSPLAKCSPNLSFQANVFTECDPLNSVIIGWVNQTAQIPQEIFFDQAISDDFKFGKYDDDIIEEAQKYQNQLADQLIALGIQVVRVGDQDFFKKFKFNDKIYTGFHCYSTRDLPMIYHNTIIQAFSASMSVNIQIKSFEWIFNKLFQKGAQWYQIKDLRESIHYLEQGSIRAQEEKPSTCPGKNSLDQLYPAWDSANILKIGLDILYLVSSSGNEAGYRFLREHFTKKYDGKVRVHPVRKVYEGVHIDTTFTIIGYNKKVKKYIVFADGSSSTTPQNMPAIFRGKNWAVIQIKQYYKKQILKGYQGLCSYKLGLNMLTINSELVVVDEKQTAIIEVLQFYGIKCIKCRLPYGREYGGGFHCLTNDINRTDVHGIKAVLERASQLSTNAELAGLFDPQLLAFLQKKGDMENWVQICNSNKIFPTYLRDHETKAQEDKKIPN